ncbi:hypothetical protein ACFWUP_26165 [Nocardia sp. NPDC058658]|uniref:hypothetical protein n=1 Tax=Nocardia sp. NPDC058658 TaxID=3346580 RepID=UPI00364D1BD8
MLEDSIDALVIPFLGGEIGEPRLLDSGMLRLQLFRRGEVTHYGPVLSVGTRSWRIDGDSGPLVAGGDAPWFIRDTVPILDGCEFRAFEARRPSWDTTFRFGEYALRIFPTAVRGPDGDLPSWSFTLGGRRALRVGVRGGWGVEQY